MCIHTGQFVNILTPIVQGADSGKRLSAFLGHGDHILTIRKETLLSNPTSPFKFKFCTAFTG
jgi:hypothetical protein